MEAELPLPSPVFGGLDRTAAHDLDEPVDGLELRLVLAASLGEPEAPQSINGGFKLFGFTCPPEDLDERDSRLGNRAFDEATMFRAAQALEDAAAFGGLPSDL